MLRMLSVAFRWGVNLTQLLIDRSVWSYTVNELKMLIVEHFAEE